jgi:hypothetical protein
MKYVEATDKVAEELGLSKDLVKATYMSFWKFIKDTIQELPLKDDLSEDDFAKLKTNFNIPSLGKLNCTYRRYLGMKKRFDYIKQLRNNAANKEG